MKARFFYWLKTHLGFSGKESRGFVLLVPVLLLLVAAKVALKEIRINKAKNFHLHYLSKIDSLESAGVALISSPYPVFNPQDTSATKPISKKLDNLNKIPFAEADSVTLQIVPGIGQSIAGRIIRFKESMGGLHSRSQLNEVYGLKPETVEAMWDYFDFVPDIFRKIPVNKADVKELAQHPYIGYSESKVIVAFRNQHGEFSSAEDFTAIKIFKQDWINKISPYLDFQ
ncbi:helix-hairpin-helix domain-containing protein [Algoriphagus sp. AGSA1]|uniref:ComEA family DNA-binding protein n=1 Tax=Algoriphagus sp. AGSA1 TaxID=2907213 RepID=UPI001F3CBF70|nr:helix-hairpin-helix domain-containing protein [Algoriphagus sp. AGSA1]MCE7053234.1 helix-hairpin-helix domain-containing protein [Algoriphagus sp. AGSA1]